MAVHSYKELVVWQRAVQVAVATYEYTEQFPRSEQFGLTSQMRRAAISISSNIAEGRQRGTKNDFVQFLRIALGSTAELESQITVAKQLLQTKNLDAVRVETLLSEVDRMLRKMISSLNPRS